MPNPNPSASQRLEHILARLMEREADERVFTRLYAGSARQEAQASDSRFRKNETLGPLDGRIVSIKDLFDVAGEATLAGSVIRKSAAAAANDALIVQRLRAAGAVIIGKTLMTEFAFTAVGLNPHYPTAGNAMDSSRVAGGSSIGAGISIAEGTSEISIGSDTGGSIRIPAALNGVTGFKPTARRVPLQGAFPLSPSLDSIGPLARNVADCAFTDSVLAGERPQPLDQFSLSGLHIGVPRGILFSNIESEIEKAFDLSLQACEKAGATIVDCSIDDLIEAMARATLVGSIAGIEASRIHAGWLRDESLDVDQRVQRPLLRRLETSESDYIDLMLKRQSLMHEMDQRLRVYNFLALPTVPIMAPSIEAVSDENFYRETETLLLRNTQVANQFDLTAISLPMPDMALPAGLMLMAQHGTDRRLLAMAMAVERILT
ncbi:aspartyl-tRNA(Asn)/glutamyl-tRNA(Gln) amidotransferase subunit A [Phyllobacterium ifriqiyense]|uniref:Aspartyl-tRNA(Asn)/glutamyl-tRNA(Gln) amidotransferase subunit A n=1 Tax=Phyllobacterium ifriqiyense TaxID=314238 RepID=A0ABU0SBU6_9HYPH|nr:amidase [Phyllobacterium ifriqiyense]MDQ0998175.1 aspartyl-tRNA(Asn)/glutamyl-tRNA(Gln) amidotransferase subunit A [Phyllobacterium ifriqiyense]